MIFLFFIDQFFTNLFQKIKNQLTWTTFFILLTGVLIGFVLCFAIYSLMIIIQIRNDKRFKQTKIENADEQKMSGLVEGIKDRFKEETEGMNVKEKLSVLGSTVFETVNIIAGEYYPDSKYPLYELSVSELLQFMHYLSNRVDAIFDKKLLKPFKKMTISQIFRFIDVKKKIEENKAVKLANRMKLGKISRIALSVINYANPVYWFRKLVTDTTVNYVINKTSLVIIDMVADETSKTYSKNIFNQERRLQQAEIEKVLVEMEEEGVE